jgi:hypothetical protein
VGWSYYLKGWLQWLLLVVSLFNLCHYLKMEMLITQTFLSGEWCYYLSICFRYAVSMKHWHKYDTSNNFRKRKNLEQIAKHMFIMLYRTSFWCKWCRYPKSETNLTTQAWSMVEVAFFLNQTVTSRLKSRVFAFAIYNYINTTFVN